jgi:tRNA pseudouridine38-40 synthase
MLQVGRGTISLQQFKEIIEAKDCTKANFTTPAHGLFLASVQYPENIFTE